MLVQFEKIIGFDKGQILGTDPVLINERFIISVELAEGQPFDPERNEFANRNARPSCARINYMDNGIQASHILVDLNVMEVHELIRKERRMQC